MANKRIPSNVLVTPLVIGALLEIAKEHIQEKENKKEAPRKVKRASITFDLGIVEKDGNIYMLDRDGVGDTDPITERNPYNVHLYGEYEGVGETVTVDLFPAIGYALKPEHLKEFATGTPESLENFIRVFGPRIEANYEIHRRFFNGQPVGC